MIDTSKFDKTPQYSLGTKYVDFCGQTWWYVRKEKSMKVQLFAGKESLSFSVDAHKGEIKLLLDGEEVFTKRQEPVPLSAVRLGKFSGPAYDRVILRLPDYILRSTYKGQIICVAEDGRLTNAWLQEDEKSSIRYYNDVVTLDQVRIK